MVQKVEFAKRIPVGSTGRLYSRWTYVFACLIFQTCTTYFFFTVFCENWKSGTKNDQPKDSLAISVNQSMVTEISLPPEELQSSTKSTVPLIILLWTWPHGHIFPLNQCPLSVDSSGCLFTVNRSLYFDANAVVINHRDVSTSITNLPPMSRPPGQYWIWFNLEPPEHLRNLTMMENIFNLTMSYRSDSDIFTPYGWIEKNDGTENFTIPQKTKLVAWVVSNWKTEQKRVKYYEQLAKYIQIDVYGKHRMPLPRKKQFKTLSEYKFYLAFENYIHEDYITEKLWYNAFCTATLPIVMGPPRKNYERFIPSDSFIHVDDFSSPKEMASYLLSLDQDDQSYLQYFSWRANYKPGEIRKTWVTEYCKVCKTIKEAPPYRTFPSIFDWFK